MPSVIGWIVSAIAAACFDKNVLIGLPETLEGQFLITTGKYLDNFGGI
jgi:hypothetical protein